MIVAAQAIELLPASSSLSQSSSLSPRAATSGSSWVADRPGEGGDEIAANRGSGPPPSCATTAAVAASGRRLSEIDLVARAPTCGSRPAGRNRRGSRSPRPAQVDDRAVARSGRSAAASRSRPGRWRRRRECRRCALSSGEVVLVAALEMDPDEARALIGDAPPRRLSRRTGAVADEERAVHHPRSARKARTPGATSSRASAEREIGDDEAGLVAAIVALAVEGEAVEGLRRRSARPCRR